MPHLQRSKRGSQFPAADPHALAAGSGYRGGGGRFPRPGRGGRTQTYGRGQGWGNFTQQTHMPPHQFHHQQHPRPPPQQQFQQQYHNQRRQQLHSQRPDCGIGGPFDNGSNAVWDQKESPPPPNAPMGSVPRCGRCGKLGHVANICAAPPRFEGTCDLCGQYGHRWQHCVKNRSAPAPPHANVVTPPLQNDGDYYYSGGGHGSGKSSGSLVDGQQQQQYNDGGTDVNHNTVGPEDGCGMKREYEPYPRGTFGMAVGHQEEDEYVKAANSSGPVSYTHLTLPIYSV